MLRDLGADEAETRLVTGRKPASRVERVFVYRDARGVPAFRVVRRDPKGFHQERSQGVDWVKGMDGVTLVPYRLPEILAAIARGDTVWFAEGEKNVDDLVALGVEATCNPGGAGKWRESFSRLLGGLRHAVVCADNDEVGAKHVTKLSRSIHEETGADITILEFEGGTGVDVSDWLQLQPAAERRERLFAYLKERGHAPSANGTPPAEPAKPTARGEPSHKPPPLTDTGNAERLVRRHGHELRYSDAYGSWIAWDGRVWRADSFAGIRLTKGTVRAIVKEASDTMDDDYRKALMRWALKSESARAREAMAALARNELLIDPDAMDADPWLLNVENGIVDLRTGTLLPHRRESLMTKFAPVAFDPGARHELWDRFLDRMVPDPEVREFLQRAAGYSLTGDTTEEKLFFIHGPTASGKSTFIAALSEVLGDYTTTCNFETFLENRGGNSATTDLARLPSVRMVLSLEVDEGRKLAIALLKAITGRDRISARHLYQKTFSYRPAFKLWLVANDRPRASASDEALWRRILMVPFEESLPRDEQDPTVKTRLTTDPSVKAAILAWAVAGARLWREGGLRPSDAVERATADYRKEQDTVGDFLDECCVFGVGLKVSNPDIRKAYEAWALANGERPMSATAFSLRLKHHGIVKDRTKTTRLWHGLRLREAVEQTSVF